MTMWISRDKATEVVECCTNRVGLYKGVDVSHVKQLLSEESFERLQKDKIRFLGPNQNTIYPWNVIDYLAEEYEAKA